MNYKGLIKEKVKKRLYQIKNNKKEERNIQSKNDERNNRTIETINRRKASHQGIGHRLGDQHHSHCHSFNNINNIIDVNYCYYY